MRGDGCRWLNKTQPSKIGYNSRRMIQQSSFRQSSRATTASTPSMTTLFLTSGTHPASPLSSLTASTAAAYASLGVHSAAARLVARDVPRHRSKPNRRRFEPGKTPSDASASSPTHSRACVARNVATSSSVTADPETSRTRSRGHPPSRVARRRFGADEDARSSARRFGNLGVVPSNRRMVSSPRSEAHAVSPARSTSSDSNAREGAPRSIRA